MKRIKMFRRIGWASTILLIMGSFLPWVSIPGTKLVFSGMQTDGSNYGKPAIIAIFLALCIVACSIIPRIWAKRLAIVIGGLLVAWTLRNYLLYMHCEMGVCPQIQIGLIFTIVATIFLFISTLFPYMPEDKLRELNS